MKLRIKKVKMERTKAKRKNMGVLLSCLMVSNDVSMEDLKHALFPHRLTKVRKANLNAKIYDIFKQV